MSALRTKLTRLPYRPTTSQHCLTTARHSSHSPSRVVNIESVRLGRPDSRTTRMASATAADTDPDSSTLPNSPAPVGATENATNIPVTVSRPAGRQTAEPTGAAPTTDLPTMSADRDTGCHRFRRGRSRTSGGPDECTGQGFADDPRHDPGDAGRGLHRRAA